MAKWQDECITMVRVLINDMSSTPIYSDRRVVQMLVVSARLVVTEISDFSYTVSLSPCSITPDPTVSNDSAFMNFISLKAACIADQSQFRTEALRSGIKAKCGPAALETVERLPGFKELLTIGPCAAYEELKKQWTFGNARICKIILGPFVSNDFDPSNLNISTTGEDRYNRMLD